MQLLNQIYNDLVNSSRAAGDRSSLDKAIVKTLRESSKDVAPDFLASSSTAALHLSGDS